MRPPYPVADAADRPPSSSTHPQLLPALYKQKSWSPDLHRDDNWIRQKGTHDRRRGRRSKSVTDEDIDELKACMELGFGFDNPSKPDDRLSNTFPALGFYRAVNQRYRDTISQSSFSSSSSLSVSESDLTSPAASSHAMFSRGDNPQTMKTRLRQWAQVVACSVRQSSSS